jgi:hypothetical protein
LSNICGYGFNGPCSCIYAYLTFPIEERVATTRLCNQSIFRNVRDLMDFFVLGGSCGSCVSSNVFCDSIRHHAVSSGNGSFGALPPVTSPPLRPKAETCSRLGIPDQHKRMLGSRRTVARHRRSGGQETAPRQGHNLVYTGGSRCSRHLGLDCVPINATASRTLVMPTHIRSTRPASLACRYTYSYTRALAS